MVTIVAFLTLQFQPGAAFLASKAPPVADGDPLQVEQFRIFVTKFRAPEADQARKIAIMKLMATVFERDEELFAQHPDVLRELLPLVMSDMLPWLVPQPCPALVHDVDGQKKLTVLLKAVVKLERMEEGDEGTDDIAQWQEVLKAGMLSDDWWMREIAEHWDNRARARRAAVVIGSKVKGHSESSAGSGGAGKNFEAASRKRHIVEFRDKERVQELVRGMQSRYGAGRPGARGPQDAAILRALPAVEPVTVHRWPDSSVFREENGEETGRSMTESQEEELVFRLFEENLAVALKQALEETADAGSARQPFDRFLKTANGTEGNGVFRIFEQENQFFLEFHNCAVSGPNATTGSCAAAASRMKVLGGFDDIIAVIPAISQALRLRVRNKCGARKTLLAIGGVAAAGDLGGVEGFAAMVHHELGSTVWLEAAITHGFGKSAEQLWATEVAMSTTMA